MGRGAPGNAALRVTDTDGVAAGGADDGENEADDEDDDAGGA